MNIIKSHNYHSKSILDPEFFINPSCEGDPKSACGDDHVEAACDPLHGRADTRTERGDRFSGAEGDRFSGAEGDRFSGAEGEDLTFYQCPDCRMIQNDADLLALEKFMLTKACRKYKNKLEIIQEKISNIITENDASDEESNHQVKLADDREIPVFLPQEEEEEFCEMPNLAYFE